MKIYLDVLFITNSIITLMYLSGLCKITHTKISRLRMILGCVFGGISSLIVVVQSQTFFQAFLITIAKLILILLTILIAFNWNGFKKLIRYFFLYIIMNALFAGCSIFLWQITGSKIIYIKNYTVYFNISLLSIIIATIIAYVFITIYDLITSRSFNKSQKYKVKYCIGNYEIILSAIADSGNVLCDSFTGAPVVVMYSNELYAHFNLDYENHNNLNGFRLIPYSTINGDGLLSVTTKGKLYVIDENDFEKEIKCYVGITRSDNNKSRAIFNPCLLL